jgi:outer membrane protein assembly factor BamB
MAETIFIGINGCVVCLDRSNGQIIWQTSLKWSGFVNVVVDGDRVIATAQGEVFCLDAATGEKIWHNKLPGLHRGLAAIATSTGSTSAVLPAEKKREDAAAPG